MSSSGRRLSLGISLGAFIASASAGQDRRGEDRPQYRVSVDTVSLAVTVLDADGRLVTDLPQDNFQIWEDGVEQAASVRGPRERREAARDQQQEEAAAVAPAGGLRWLRRPRRVSLAASPRSAPSFARAGGGTARGRSRSARP